MSILYEVSAAENCMVAPLSRDWAAHTRMQTRCKRRSGTEIEVCGFLSWYERGHLIAGGGLHLGTLKIDGSQKLML